MSIKLFTLVTENTHRFICTYADCRQTELGSHGFLPAHFEKIKTAISENNAAKLADYLTYTMQYSQIYHWNQGEWHSNDDYHIASRYYMNTCSVVEGLLRLHPEKLAFIVKFIADQNNKSLYDAFAKSLSFASLSENGLSAWDHNIKNKLEDKISNFKKYAEEKLKKTDPTKAQAVIDVAAVLKEKINYLETRSYNDEEGCDRPLLDSPNFLARLRTLQFKLEFQAALHTKDEALNRHRGYARFASNVFSILFTAGILNVVNYVATGRFLLFSQTKTQRMVAGIENAVSSTLKI